jgi:DNA-binding NtrC family response regulator
MDATVAGPLHVKIRGGTLQHTESQATLTIDDEPRIVGRGPSCALRLTDRRVSTAHCEVMATDRGVLLRDLGSTNGTWVGEAMVGPRQYVLLRRATTLRLGDTELAFAPTAPETRALARSVGTFESRSLRMQRVLDQILRLAEVTAAVHITGESGTGKGFVARALHDHGPRASKAFVVIDCAALAPSLVEAELFGYEKGAFTGATRRKESPFVDGDGGTVFLDEIGDLPLDMQARLLRVVDEGEVKSVGQNAYRKVDVRIVSATLHDLAARVNVGLFREDLYSRLTAARIELPPLRDRREDIEPLVRRIFASLGRAEVLDELTPAHFVWLGERPWTKGNVRQLRQVIKLALDLRRNGPLDIEGAYAMNGGGDVARAPASSADRTGDDAFAVVTAKGTSHAAVTREASRILFERLVRETNGNVSEMCRRADVSRPFLRDLLSKLGLREVEAPRRKRRAG